MNLLRKLRIIAALLLGGILTFLFLDFTGTIHGWLGWTARIQFWPAVLALNVGVVVGLLLLTLLFGRIYCSVVCPLGLFQDAATTLNRRRNRFRHSPALQWLRYGSLVLFGGSLVVGVAWPVALLEPYSAYGRMVSGFLAPLYGLLNNLLAYFAERADSYLFYSTEVWVRSVQTLAVAGVTFAIVGFLAWRSGRTYCNTICSVGTLLGFVARFSLFKHRIDLAQCNGCGLCARNCKASCIDSKKHTIDYSRCVACFNCVDHCSKKAISYRLTDRKAVLPVSSDQLVDRSRRGMMTLSATLLAATALRSEEKLVDGGLAYVENKQIPDRKTPIVPPGARSARHFRQHCTACQLCVSVCPNGVLRPTSDLKSFMQPVLSYERGYCRPECTRCSEVCPSKAIRPITKADKSAMQIGRAVWLEKNCLSARGEAVCDNCARHCPVGAIQMIARNADSQGAVVIPAVNTERCIGCGACENLCPSRPFSAIYVEGNLMHRTV